MYYFRDQQGLEVDFVIPRGGDRLFMLEAKSSRTLKPAMADSLLRLKKNAEKYRTGLYLVHPDPGEETFKIGKEGVSIAPVSELPGILFGR